MTHADSLSTVADDARCRAYPAYSSVFIELDDGDKRFLRALPLALRADATDYVLTISHFWTLVHLGAPEGRTMVELAQLLMCDKSNVTAIADKFEEQGWARRIREKAGDRRYMRVILTVSGRAARRLAMDAHREWIERRLAVLSDDQLDQLTTLLGVMKETATVAPEGVVAGVVAATRARGASRGTA